MGKFASIKSVLVVLVAFLALKQIKMCACTIAWAGATKSMSVSDVKLSNLWTFEVQIRRDLPVGTSKAEVEAYLSYEKIPHSFVNSSYAQGGNAFYGTLKNIGYRWGFEADLAIRIHLDNKQKVDRIWFRVDYDAP